MKREEIVKKYKERCLAYPTLMNQIDAAVNALDEKMAFLLQYICTALTVADLSEVELEVLLDYAVQSHTLYQNFERVRELPEEIFLEYVVNPKAANEELDICRTAFYHLFLGYLETEDQFWNKELAKKVEDRKEFLTGKTEERIISEVNFWCAGEADAQKAIKAKADGRMVSARTVFATGRGNEQEVAIYVVQALRSLGIPARILSKKQSGEDERLEKKTLEEGICEKQLADDEQHIWIEVYCYGKWQKIAACEPWYRLESAENIEAMENADDAASKKHLIARKARAQGNHYGKAKRWRNEEKEKFFFGDITTMSFRAKLLKMMSEKDEFDMKYDVMEEHFTMACEERKIEDEELFLSYVLNPRIAEEVLTAWRKPLKAMFAEKEEAFRENPSLLWKEIDTAFEEISEEELGRAYISPMGCLKLKKGSGISKQILFVAAARTLQIPSRYCAENEKAEYWNGNGFQAV